MRRYKVTVDGVTIHSTGSERLVIQNGKVKNSLNEIPSFTFSMFPNHPHYDGVIKKMLSVIRVYRNGTEIFRGRALKAEVGLKGKITYTCEGALAYLKDATIPWHGDMSVTPAAMLTNAVSTYNSQVESFKRFNIGTISASLKAGAEVYSSDTEKSAYEYIKARTIDADGRKGTYLIVRFSGDAMSLDWVDGFSAQCSQVVKFGKNILDYDETINGSNVATYIKALGKKGDDTNERQTIGSSSIPSGSGDFKKNGDWIYSPSAVAKFGIIRKTVTNDALTDASNVMSLAVSSLKESLDGVSSRKIKFIDLSMVDGSVDDVDYAKNIHVVSKPHGVDEWILIDEIEENINKPSDSTITLGNEFPSATRRSAQGAFGKVNVKAGSGIIISNDNTISAEVTPNSFISDAYIGAL